MLEWDKMKGMIEADEDPEQEIENQWEALKDKLMTITQGEEAGITQDDKNAVKELLDEMEDLLG